MNTNKTETKPDSAANSGRVRRLVSSVFETLEAGFAEIGRKPFFYIPLWACVTFTLLRIFRSIQDSFF